MRRVTPTPPNPDANLAAGALAKTLNKPVNLGIGTLPGHKYCPIDATDLQRGKAFLTSFLGLDVNNLDFIPAKGGGTGAISAGLSALRAMGYRPESLGFSAWDWAGYESFCTAHGLKQATLPDSNYTAEDPNILFFLQTNRNGDGTRFNLEAAEKLIAENNRLARPNFIDLPYFTGSHEEKEVLRLFQTKAEQPTIMSWSPTKIFQTFEDRPGGVTIILWPNSNMAKLLSWVPATVARGTTGFDDATTRALWTQMAQNSDELLERHKHYLAVIKTATDLWRRNAPSTAQNYFNDADFGGMFRLFPADREAQARLAEQNIVAVLMQSGDEYRVRVNICGLIKPDGTAVDGAEETIKNFFSNLNL